MIYKKIFSDDPAYVATSYNNFSLVYGCLGEYNEGKELFEKALMR